jgi:hypothetical protein
MQCPAAVQGLSTEQHITLVELKERTICDVHDSSGSTHTFGCRLDVGVVRQHELPISPAIGSGKKRNTSLSRLFFISSSLASKSFFAAARIVAVVRGKRCTKYDLTSVEISVLHHRSLLKVPWSSLGDSAEPDALAGYLPGADTSTTIFRPFLSLIKTPWS